MPASVEEAAGKAGRQLRHPAGGQFRRWRQANVHPEVGSREQIWADATRGEAMLAPPLVAVGCATCR